MKKSCPTHLYTVGYDETKTLSRTFSKNFVVDDFVPDEQHTPPAWPEKASIRAIPHELASKQTHPKETMRRKIRLWTIWPDEVETESEAVLRRDPRASLWRHR